MTDLGDRNHQPNAADKEAQSHHDAHTEALLGSPEAIEHFCAWG